MQTKRFVLPAAAIAGALAISFALAEAPEDTSEDLSWWFRNEVNTEVDELVPFEVVERIALERAVHKWGNVTPGTPIACSDERGDLVTWMCPFRIGTEPFPSYPEILEGVKEGRRRVHEVAASSSPPEFDEAGGTGPAVSYQTALKQARMKGLGIGEYGTVYVSARYDRYPIPLCSHYLPPLFHAADLARETAGAALQREAPTLVRYYFLGRRGQYFEFESGSEKTIVHAQSLEVEGEPAFEPITPSPEAIEGMARDWAALGAISEATEGGK